MRLLKWQLGAGGDGGRWLVPVLLLIGVLAPAACVLWFMNAAIDNQRDASRRKLAEAYRGQLKLVRDRMESYWEQRAADLEREAHDGTAPAIFARVVERGLADSAVCLNRDGSAAYPVLATPVAPDSTLDRPDWMAARTLESWTDPHIAAESYAAIAKKEPDVSLAARAAQAQIRCLARSGDKAAALRAIQDNFGGGRLVRGADANRRLIAADEWLLAMRLSCGAGWDPARAVANRRAGRFPVDPQLAKLPHNGGSTSRDDFGLHDAHAVRAAAVSDGSTATVRLFDLRRRAAGGAFSGSGAGAGRRVGLGGERRAGCLETGGAGRANRRTV